MKVEQNNSKNKKSYLIKKSSFLSIIFLMIIAHFIVYYSDLRGPIRGAWFSCIWGAGLVLTRFCYLYCYDGNFRKYQKNLNKSLKSTYNILLKKHFNNQLFNTSLAEILDVERDIVSFYHFTNVNYVLIEYCFNINSSSQNFVGVKTLNLCKFFFTPNFPKIGDKIEIIYNKDNPEESVIIYQESKKVKWYQCQPKYEIKVIQQ